MAPEISIPSTAIVTVVIMIALIITKCISMADNAVKHEDNQTPIETNIAVRDFAKIRYQKTFVDKTLMIKTVLSERTSQLITAPRSFGKSINLSMLKRFFERLPDPAASAANRALFENLKISHYTEIMEKHCGMHPVLHLGFKLSRAIRSFDDAREFVRNVFHKVFISHSYLRQSDVLEANEREYVKTRCDIREYKKLDHNVTDIEVLCEYLYKHFNQTVIVLIDDYDSVCSEAMTSIEDANEIEKIVIFFRKMIANLLHRNSNELYSFVVTATSSISTEQLGNDKYTYKTYKFQENIEYSQFYGLTETEVKELLHRFGRESDFDQVKKHYNGYNNNTFDIWSVTNYLKSGGKIRNYWKTSGNAIDLKNVLEITELKTKLFRFISDINDDFQITEAIIPDQKNRIKLTEILNKPPRDTWNLKPFYFFLLERGYFSIFHLEAGCRIDDVIIRIANNQIKSHIRECLIEYYQNIYNLNVELAKKCASVFDEFGTSTKHNEMLLKKIHNLLNKILGPLHFNVRNEDTIRHVIFAIISFSSTFKGCFETSPWLAETKTLMVRSDLIIVIKSLFCDDAETALKSLLSDEEKGDNFSNNSTINNKIFVSFSMSTKQKVSLCALINGTDFNNTLCL